ncbi:M6 family metalloprotease domain-containing protein [Barnesiella viscericola]|uniref:M6 family metalloprotease domain-containing protein n=1 Tax=Barnesiella viscericola TaxID=397865 RepID=UPI0025A3E450|nr:M6 family metalloprotease domain-containing protein [Barnesiella viscericola]MDM8268071.1 M6 family metalloprotease domain-containing protein [Barnesiella viscericola]
MKKVFITLCASVFLGVSSLFALPARSIPETVTQPDGTVVTVRVVGDEFYHYQMTADGIPVVRGTDGFYRYAELTPDGTVVAGQVIARDAHLRTASDKVYLEQLATRQVSQGMVAQRQLKRQQKLRSVTRRAMQATTGDDVHGLVLLVEFSDQKFNAANTLEDFKEMMNKEGYNYQGAIGSARDYFIAQSGGQFRPTFDVVGPITLDKTMAYYGGNDKYTGNDSRPEEMVIDACRKVESTVDFSIYDRDNDGFVDLVYVIYAGYGESANDNAGSLDDTIWPHAWYIYQGAGKEVSVDGKLLDAYACSAELQGNTGTYRDGIGSFCHEYSHTLGLPDFYDTGGSNYGMSTWSLMDYGCYNGPDMNGDGHSDGSVPVGYTAYEREFCGWLTIEELTSPATVSLENLADSKKAYKIVSSDKNQYFTLENRQQTGWDTYMASSGLMILKVDYDQMIWDNNIVNCEPTRQRMTIMPADNHRSFYDETGDLYPYNNNNSFTDQSAPASKTNTGLSLGKPVTNITQANGVITFDFMGGSAIDAPVANEATGITATGFTANWSPVEGAASYTLYVDRRQPSAGGEILLSEDFAKCTTAGTANLGGTNAFQTVDGQYFQTSGWSGKYLYPEEGMMKMGNSSNGGALCTPAIDLSSNGGTFTVQFAASRYNNDKEKSVMKVYLEGDEAHAQTTEMLPLDAMNTYTLTFTGGTESSKIVFESTADSGKKRAYIDNIVVYSGEVQPEAMAKPAAVEWPMVIEGITETAYSLTGLEPGYLYSYKVKAVTDDSKESAYSNVVKVDLSSGICDVLEVNHRIYAAEGGIVIECETAQPVEIVNLAGQVVASTEVNGRAVVPVPAAGVYIVRCGAAATRVMVR